MKVQFNKALRNLRSRWERKPSFRYGAYFVVTFLALTWILSSNFIPNPFRPELGKQSPIDITAQRDINVVDKVATEETRHAAEVAIPLIYKIDVRKKNEALHQVNRVFSNIREVVVQRIPPNRQIAILRRVMPFPISEKTLLTLLNTNRSTRDHIKIETQYILGKIMDRGIQKSDIPQAHIAIEQMTKGLPIPGDYADAIAELSQEALIPNYFPDWDSIQKKQAAVEERYRLNPIMRHLQKGEPIISKGEVVTEEKMDILHQLGYFASSPTYLTLLGMAILTLLFLGVLVFYVVHYNPNLIHEEKHLILFALIIFVTAFISKLLIPLSGYLAPITMASILIAILFDGRLSLVATAFLSLTVGLFTNEMRDIVVAFVGSAVAIFSISRVSNRFQMTSTIFLIAIVNVITIMCFALLENESLSQFIHEASFGGGNGLLSVMLAIVILPFLEQFAGITTTFRLLELANPSSPLLRHLLVECPGTYHHSILVANLAENAAQAVKANPLLVRVGAYYHDIGKMRRPYFFIENQVTGENPHDKLNPTLSTLIVTAHPKDGLEMAKSHKLPKEVQDIIVQHHGTQPVNYFYHQAVTKEGTDNVNRDDFRHEGPKPQSREAAILMLSDAVEAATRSLVKPTPSKIEQTVKEVIRGAMLDGQLDECNLSFHELSILIGTFTRLLTGIHHQRIEYPDTSKLLREKVNAKWPS